MDHGLLYFLQIGLAIAVVVGGLYWALGAAARSSKRSHAQRRDELAARAQYRQPWNPDSTSGRANR